MAVINFQIICNWSNEEKDTQVKKRIFLHLGEQSADSTSKTLHLGNRKSRYNYSRPSQALNDACFNLQGHIIIARNEERRYQNKPCTARPLTFWENSRLL